MGGAKLQNIHITYKEATKTFMKRCFSEESITGSVLEIGSGRDKFNRKLFTNKYKVITTNIYPKNVVDYICSVNYLPFEDNKFGCVICEHVLEHLEEPAKAIDEIKRVLKPKGLLILVVPFSWPIHEKPYDLWRFSEEGLRALLMNKFEGVNFTTIGPPKKPALICVTARKPIYKEQKLTHPKISVIMPTYNRADMIGRSIESVLNQTFKDWELIIVSDGSTDNTRGVVKKYTDPRIVFLEKENGGPSSARNFGLRHARGEYISYCDDDDIIFPYHLEVLVNYLQRHLEVAMVRGAAITFNYNVPKRKIYLKEGFLWNVMHRFRYLKKKIYFDNKQLTDEDIEFILRFSDRYSVRILQIIVAAHVLHKRNFTVVNKQVIWKYNDRVYTKRIKFLCQNHQIQKQDFLMLSYFLIQKRLPRAILEIALFFYRQHPCPEAIYLLAWAYYRTGDSVKAAKFLRKLLDYRDAIFRRGIISKAILREYGYGFLTWIYSQQKNGEKRALKYTTEGLRKHPKSNLIKIETFHAYLENGDRKRAMRIYETIKNAQLHIYCKGVLAIIDSQWERAEQYFNKLKYIDQVFKYRLYNSLSYLNKLRDRTKHSQDASDKTLLFSRYTWSYPFLLTRNLKGYDFDKMRSLLKHIFLVDSSHDKQILESFNIGNYKLKK